VASVPQDDDIVDNGRAGIGVGLAKRVVKGQQVEGRLSLGGQVDPAGLHGLVRLVRTGPGCVCLPPSTGGHGGQAQGNVLARGGRVLDGRHRNAGPYNLPDQVNQAVSQG